MKGMGCEGGWAVKRDGLCRGMDCELSKRILAEPILQNVYLAEFRILVRD